MNTGEKIRFYRKKAGLTQQQLGDKIGLPYQRIGQYENSTRTPRDGMLIKIAGALDIDWKTLIDDKYIVPYTERDMQEFQYYYERQKDWEELQKTNLDNIEPGENKGYPIELVDAFEKLNSEGKQKVIDYAKDLSGNKEYQKEQ